MLFSISVKSGCTTSLLADMHKAHDTGTRDPRPHSHEGRNRRGKLSEQPPNKNALSIFLKKQKRTTWLLDKVRFLDSPLGESRIVVVVLAIAQGSSGPSVGNSRRIYHRNPKD